MTKGILAPCVRHSTAFTRRSLLFSPLFVLPAIRTAVAAPIQAGIPSSRRLNFEVFRGGSPIGTHTLTFAINNDELVVTIDIKIAVNVGPLTVFRYGMQGTEHWRGGRFVALDTTTNDDGDHHTVSIRRTDGGLFIQSAGFPDRTAPPLAAPLTHWSMASLSGPLLSPQDGQPMQATVTAAGAQDVTLADGRSVRATGYNISTHTPTQDWYDAEQIWVGLHAKTKDGSLIDYHRSA
jgi:hypothetical protein